MVDDFELLRREVTKSVHGTTAKFFGLGCVGLFQKRDDESVDIE